MKWINAESRLPKTQMDCLVWRKNGVAKIAWYSSLYGFWVLPNLDRLDGVVTHWTYIKPPKQKEQC